MFRNPLAAPYDLRVLAGSNIDPRRLHPVDGCSGRSGTQTSVASRIARSCRSEASCLVFGLKPDEVVVTICPSSGFSGQLRV
jgi:hypothetical protein